MKMINDSVLKVDIPADVMFGGQVYPYCILPFLPDTDCVFDSFHGTIGFDVYPFAVTTRINASNQIFLKVYENDTNQCG